MVPGSNCFGKEEKESRYEVLHRIDQNRDETSVDLLVCCVSHSVTQSLVSQLNCPGAKAHWVVPSIIITFN